MPMAMPTAKGMATARALRAAIQGSIFAVSKWRTPSQKIFHLLGGGVSLGVVWMAAGMFGLGGGAVGSSGRDWSWLALVNAGVVSATFWRSSGRGLSSRGIWGLG